MIAEEGAIAENCTRRALKSAAMDSRVAGWAEEEGRRGEGAEENPAEAICVAGTDYASMWISSDLCKGIAVPNGDSACLCVSRPLVVVRSRLGEGRLADEGRFRPKEVLVWEATSEGPPLWPSGSSEGLGGER